MVKLINRIGAIVSWALLLLLSVCFVHFYYVKRNQFIVRKSHHTRTFLISAYAKIKSLSFGVYREISVCCPILSLHFIFHVSVEKSAFMHLFFFFFFFYIKTLVLAHATKIGLSPSQGTILVSVFSAVNVIGRIVSG
jgi:hypothetical protein